MKKILYFLILLFMISFTSAFDWTDGRLVSYWDLNDTTGVVIDKLGINNGTANSVTRGVTGKIENGFDFLSASNSWVKVPRTASLEPSAFTINLWVKTALNDNNQFLLCKDSGGGAYSYCFETRTSAVFRAANYKSGGSDQLLTMTGYAANQWYMLTLVSNSSGSYFYVNGTLADSSTDTGATNYNSAYNLSFGRYETLTTEDFNGTLDEIGIWNRSLTLAEITELYNSGNGLAYLGGSTSTTITLLNPTNNSQLTTSEINFTATISPLATTINITNETLYIWYSNGTLHYTNTSTTSGNTAFNNTWMLDSGMVNFSLGQSYLWNVKAVTNQSTNAWASNNFTFTASAYDVSVVTYESSVYETAYEDFLLQIDGITTINSVTGKLWYNGSSYTSTVADGTGGGAYNVSNSISIPLQDNGQGNKTFFWQLDFILVDGTTIQQNTTSYTQEVNRTYIELCNSTYNVPIVNFSIKNAENPFPSLNGTFKIDWQWHLGTGTGGVLRNISYEDINENKSEFDFCTKNYTTPFIVTSTINYDASSFSPNFYYLTNATLTNTTQEIDLFLLNESKATITELIVRGAAQKAIPDAIIQIQFYDVGTGTYQTVAMAKTNYEGKDFVYLNWYDSPYKFIIISSGSVIKSTNPYKIGETPQKFDILDTIVYSWEKFRDFQYTLTFNEATGNFVLTFTKPSGEVDEGCLRVIKRTPRNDTEICLTCESSSSATLFCDIDAYGNGTYIATFYATGSIELVDWIAETIGGSFADEINEALGLEDATAYALIFSVLIVSLFLITPVLAVIGLLLSIFASAALGFSTMDYMVYFGILVMGGILIWILKR